MEEKIEDVIACYPINVKGRRRIRGAYLLEAQEGDFSLKSCQESEKRLLFQEKVKECLIRQGYTAIDTALKNTAGQFRTKDGMGGYWVLRRWQSGRECNMQDEDEVCAATRHLAKLHQWMCITKEEQEDGKEIPECCHTHADDEVCLVLHRHTREMKRVYNYIRDKKRKNEMEICLLNSFQNFYAQATETEKILEEIDYETHLRESVNRGCVLHGSYNYHNVLFQGEQIITTNFGKAEFGVQILDLYDFVRKLMEKNSWKLELGLRVIEQYCEQKQPEDWEKKVLFLMLCYPEKYWKLMNFYYNGKKSWMSAKNYEKLQKICNQEIKRKKFLTAAKGLLI